MANYNLVINSKFSPFSYLELLAPVLLATLAHLALEEAYGDLDTLGEAIGSKINPELDPVAYKRYLDFKLALDALAEDLARHGLNVGSRRALFRTKGDYAKNVYPILEAITRRRLLADEQRLALTLNPTLFFLRDFNTLSKESSLDRFLENPDYSYGERASGALIAQQVGEAAANLKTWLRSRGNLKGVGIPYLYEQLLEYGFKPEDILKAINNPLEGDPVLTAIVNLALTSSGILDWGSPQLIAEARALANNSLWKAVGQTLILNYTDQYGMLSALAREAEQRAAAREAARAALDDLIRNANVPIDLSTLLFGGDSDNSALLLLAGSKDPLDSRVALVDRLTRLVQKNSLLSFYDLGISNKKGGKAKGGVNIDVPIGFTNNTHFYNFYKTNPRVKGSHNLLLGDVDEKTKFKTRPVRLWDNNGRMLSKEQFIKGPSSGREPDAETLANRRWYWDKKIVPFLRAAGFSDSLIGRSGTITKKDLEAARDNIYTMGSPKQMSAIAIPFTDNSKAMNRVLTRASSGDKVSIYKVTGVNNDGTITHSSKLMDLSDFIDDEDKIIGNPEFFAAPNGLIIIKTTGSDNAGMYVVDASKISSSLGRSAYNINMPELKKWKDGKAEVLLELVNNQGYTPLEAEQVFALSPIGLKINQTIDLNGGAFVKDIANLLSFEIKNSAYSIVSSGE